MKKMILAFAVLTVSSIAMARPNTTTMTCAQARQLVSNSGAIVLSTGRYTYDRYVAHGGYCVNSEVTHPAWVPTRDKGDCFIGYVCRPNDRG